MNTHPSLGDALGDYLALRRALGFKLAAAGRLLGQFVDYLSEHGVGMPTTDDALAWANLPACASANWRAIRLSVVRGFASYLHGLDASVEVPSADLIRRGPDRATPYLYADSEIRGLLAAAGELSPPLRAATYQTLIGLLATCGLRVSEAIALNSTDLDPDEGLLVIRETKFAKSRLVPLHSTTQARLAAYITLRDQTRAHPLCPALLISGAGTRLHHSNVSLTFAGLAQRVGITRRSAVCRPRLHDLRHSYAVATVLDWYRTGADVPAMMPRLATYLGHSDPKHTFWYLTAAPELMALAGQRLDTYLGDRS
jgi:integrase/recombinase XerD